jgi:positive regulator of sigma E activity
MEVANPMGAKPGERVIITLPPEALLKATTLAYLFPATLMVVGATVGWSLKGTDMGALLGALTGLAVSSLYIYIHGRMKKAPQGPAISKILPRGVITQDQY